MLYTVEDDIELCNKFELSPSQLMFVKTLVPDLSYEDEKTRRIKAHELCMRYEKVIKGITPLALADLISREIIIDYNTIGQMKHEYYEINKSFSKHFELAIYPMPAQLFDAYPGFIFINGQRYTGRNVSQEEIAKEYLRAIKNNEDEHQEVLKDLEWAKEKEAIKMGLKKFVLSRFWIELRELRLKNNDNQEHNDIKIV